MTSYRQIEGISKNTNIGKECYSFYKYDGSNLRWEWNKKRGFFKYGTRKRMFDESDEQFGDAVKLFKENYEEKITKILVDNFKQEKVVIFTEYFGENSFSGSHIETDKKQLVLFDIHIIKKGILEPKEFLKKFGDLDFSAELLYEGKFNKEYINKIRENKDGYLNEGVVVKGGKGHNLWMGKIKTLSFLDRLKKENSYELLDNIKEQNIII